MSKDVRSPRLTIRNVPPHVNDRDLEAVFRKYAGFRSMKRFSQYSVVEYDNSGLSTRALEATRGFRFRATEKPLIIEYERDNDGKEEQGQKRKDYTDGDRDDAHSRDRDRHRREPSRPPPDESYRLLSTYDYYDRHDTRRPSPPRSAFPPSPTLFVDQLPMDASERELAILFRFMPGFDRMRLIPRQGKTPIGFADFADAAHSSLAMQQLQGYRLDVRDPDGIRIDFDRSSRSRPFSRFGDGVERAEPARDRDRPDRRPALDRSDDRRYRSRSRSPGRRSPARDCDAHRSADAEHGRQRGPERERPRDRPSSQESRHRRRSGDRSPAHSSNGIDDRPAAGDNGTDDPQDARSAAADLDDDLDGNGSGPSPSASGVIGPDRASPESERASAAPVDGTAAAPDTDRLPDDEDEPPDGSPLGDADDDLNLDLSPER